MTFHTHHFGELPDGAIGPLFLIFYPSILIYITWYAMNRRQAELADRLPVAVFLLGLSFLASLTYLMGTPYMRFWNIGLAIIAISLGSAFSHISELLKPYYRRWVSVMLSFALLWISFSALIGYYAAPSAIGWPLYTGKIDRDDYLKRTTGNAYLYVNRNIRPEESIIAIGYEQINTFNNPTIQLNVWNDKNMRLKSLKDYEDLVRGGNVRYWILKDVFVKGDVGKYYEDVGVAQKYWQEQFLVYSQDGFSVYTTKLPDEPKQTLLKEIKLSPLSNTPTRTDGWTVPGNAPISNNERVQSCSDRQVYHELNAPDGAHRISGIVFFGSDRDGAMIIGDIIWFNNDHVVQWKVKELISARGTQNILNFNSSRPFDANKVRIVVRPWRPKDGIITIGEATIRWWE